MTAASLAALAAAAALWLAYRLGRARAERDFREKAHDDATAATARARRIDEEVARLGDDDLARRLRPFRRDGMPMGKDDRAGPRGPSRPRDRAPDPRP